MMRVSRLILAAAVLVYAGVAAPDRHPRDGAKPDAAT